MELIMNLLNRVDAAQYLSRKGLKTASATLAKLAVTGDGPPYRLWQNRAVYEVTDLDQWASTKLGPKIQSSAQRH